MNTLQRSYKIYNVTLTVSPHYLLKLKPHKTAHFEVSRHSILLLNSKNESVSCVLQVVFKMSIFCTDIHIPTGF